MLANTSRQSEITVDETSGRNRAMIDDVLTANKATTRTKFILMFIEQLAYEMFIMIIIESHQYR